MTLAPLSLMYNLAPPFLPNKMLLWRVKQSPTPIRINLISSLLRAGQETPSKYGADSVCDLHVSRSVMYPGVASPVEENTPVYRELFVDLFAQTLGPHMGYYSVRTLGVNTAIKRRHAQVAVIDTGALPTPPLKRPCPFPIRQFELIRLLPRGYYTRLELP